MSRPISDPVFDIGGDLQRAYDEGYKQGGYDEKVETETSLPSGEQTHALRTETHACDLIKCQDAIDAFEDTTYTKNEIRRRITELPSAEPKREECEEREQGLCPFYAG